MSKMLLRSIVALLLLVGTDASYRLQGTRKGMTQKDLAATRSSLRQGLMGNGPHDDRQDQLLRSSLRQGLVVDGPHDAGDDRQDQLLVPTPVETTSMQQHADQDVTLDPVAPGQELLLPSHLLASEKTVVEGSSQRDAAATWKPVKLPAKAAGHSFSGKSAPVAVSAALPHAVQDVTLDPVAGPAQASGVGAVVAHASASSASAKMEVPTVPWWVLLIVCICFVILLIVFVFYFGAILLGRSIKTTIEALDQKFLGVDVEIGHLSVSICSGRVDISGFQIHNPEGYKAPYFLNADHVVIDLKMTSLLKSRGKTVEVEELEMKDIDMIVEYDSMTGPLGGTTNVQRILDFMNNGGDEKPSEKKKKRAEEVKKASGKAPPAKKGEPAQVLVHKVVFKGIGARLATKLAGVRVALADIEYEDFSKTSNTGLIEDVVWEIMKTFNKTILTNITGKSFMERFT